MAFLDGKDRTTVKDILDSLKHQVTIIYFTQELECQYCHETTMLLEEMEELSDKLVVKKYNFQTDKELLEKYPVDKIPAIIPTDESGKDYGIRFYGIPAGYEFTSLLEGIRLVGNGDSGLSEDIRESLKKITEPTHLQVFVTPTCPYCPTAVINAHKMAYENGNIRADMVEVTEFPHLAVKYKVQGVPRSVINEDTFVEGAVPDGILLDKIVEAYQQAQNHH